MKVEIPLYEGNLNVEDVINWISVLYMYFDFEEVKDKNKVILIATKLKDHAAIWWDEIQISKERKERLQIKQ